MMRPLVAAAGLCGAIGVALSALAAHRGGGNVMVASTFLLIHAAALLAIGLMPANRIMRIGGWVLLAGVVLFTLDLSMRDLLGTRFLPMAAPAGGLLMIGGWLVVAASALFARRAR